MFLMPLLVFRITKPTTIKLILGQDRENSVYSAGEGTPTTEKNG